MLCTLLESASASAANTPRLAVNCGCSWQQVAVHLQAASLSSLCALHEEVTQGIQGVIVHSCSYACAMRLHALHSGNT